MRPLDAVREASANLQASERVRVLARRQLGLAMVDASRDGVPLTVIAKAAGVSRKTVERLIASLADVPDALASLERDLSAAELDELDREHDDEG